MDRKIIIAINGGARTGKDSFYLANSDNSLRMAFADKLKQLAFETFGTSPKKELLDEKLARKQRDVWIYFGQAGRLATGGKVWVDMVIDQIIHDEPKKPIVITDVGFINEIVRLKQRLPEYKIIPLRVERPGQKFIEDGRENISKDLPTVHLCNAGTLDEYYLKSRVLFEELTRI